MTREEQLACLEDRHCSVCKFHTDVCNRWSCVFEEEPEEQQSLEDSIAINDWLSSFNTDSATVCFTEIQKLKEQIGTLNNCTNCKYKDLRNYNYPCVNCSNNYTNMFENKEN